MGKILIDRIIKEIRDTPGVNNARIFHKVLLEKVAEHVSDPAERERARSEVAREMIKIRVANLEKAS